MGVDSTVFYRESSMSPIVSGWMRSQGLEIKQEFETPWGVCDLAGLAFRQTNVKKRLQLRQRVAVGSVLRTALLIDIPDRESGEYTTRGTLKKRWSGVIDDDSIETEINWLEKGNFIVPDRYGRLQRLNGWVPLHRRLVAIELKLDRIEEVFQQARHNLRFADESYVALPADVASRVRRNGSRWQPYIAQGIGLLSVNTDGCRMLLKSRPDRTLVDESVQLYCVDKFWRTLPKGS